jgi:polysaccharide biosynthesis/export protein
MGTGTGTKLFIAFFCLWICSTSCVTTNKIAYLQNGHDTTYKQTLGVIEAPLQANDFVSISISSLDAGASAIFNPNAQPQAGNNTENGGPIAAAPAGYLISPDGYIQLPLLGNIKVAGLTRTQLKEHITSLILSKKLLVDPIVEIRFLNFEVTILGEVGRPAVISVPSEKISLLKALAIAGDLTIYGKRDNIMLVREEGGIRKTRRLDISQASFLNSEYYYLRPNDIVYVEPNKLKLSMNSRTQQILPLALTSVSLLVFVIDRVVR